MRVAAFDIGSNSIHLLVVEVHANGSFTVIDREKEMVRLGADSLDGGTLSETATATAVATLARFKRLADSHGTQHVVAAATSAVREAVNGGEFLSAVEREAGIRARVISGLEEARLIHQAAVYGVQVKHRKAVVIDVGGGSTEIAVGSQEGAETTRTFKLGVIRLTDRFVASDPLSVGNERRLVRHIRKQTAEFVQQLKTRGFDDVIGTSGTILALGALAKAGGSTPWREGIHHVRVTAKQLHRVRKLLAAIDLPARLKLPDLDPRRADTVVAGAVLLDTLLRDLDAEALTLCDYALREGLILDFVRHNAADIARADRFPDIRRRSVYELAERCGYLPDHAAQVVRLALSLFDATVRWHRLPERAREWLEYAALLHDIGMHISYTRHHKHSYYLIVNGGLRGFAPAEVETIGLIARYHRRSAPRRTQVPYARLPRANRRAVATASALLRIAEALDRSHSGIVEQVTLREDGEGVAIDVRAKGDVGLELWAARRQTGPLERLLNKTIRIGLEGESHDQQPDAASRVPGKAVRRRRDRRVGQDDAAGAASEVAGGRGAARVRHRVEELLDAGEGGDEGGQEEEPAHTDDPQPAARDGLRGSAGVQDRAPAQGGHDRPRRPVRVHGVRS